MTAAFCYAKLGIKPDLIATLAADWLGRMFVEMATKYDVRLHERTVESSSLSFIVPKNGKRAIVRCRDDHYLTSCPELDLKDCRALHAEGHQADAALYYAQRCRKAGILTSLDGGGLRVNTHDLLTFIDVAIVAERFSQQMDKMPQAMLEYLKSRGCKIGGVTLGERGSCGTTRTAVSRRCQRIPFQPNECETQAAPVTFSRCLYLFLSHQTKPKLEGSFPIRDCRLDIQDPASWQRFKTLRRSRPSLIWVPRGRSD